MNNRKWTEQELNFLIENYCLENKEYCAKELNRTISSIDSKASRLGLKAGYTWSIEDVAFLKENYLNIGRAACAKLLGRTVGSIAAKAHDLGLNKYDPDYYYKFMKSHKSIELLGVFTGAHVKITHRCKMCNYVWEASPAKIKYGRGCPQCARRSYSKACIQWLSTFNNPNIKHAENGGEQVIAGYKVDGYDSESNTVYEFHGDIFHGNLDIFKESDCCNPFNRNVTAGELWDKTFNRMSIIAKKVDRLIYIWERDYNLGKTYEIF